MKKIIILSVMLAFVASSHRMFAQTDVSLIGGLYHTGTKSSAISNDFVDLNPITGFSGGVIVNHPLDDLLSLRTGVIYQKKGFRAHEGTAFDVFGMNVPVGVKLLNEISYIEVPALLQAQIFRGDDIGFYIAGGPSFAYATSGTLKTRASSILDFNISNTPIDLSSDNYNRIDISANILAGMKIPYGSSHFLLEAGYGQALNDFVSDSFIIDTGGKHYGWSVNVGYGISF